MFVKELYGETRREALHALMLKYPFGSLVTTRSTGIEIDHFPFGLYSDVGAHGTLRCHVDRGNPVWQALRENDQVLVTFQSPSSYISPNWMPGRPRHRKTAPSWNYAAVHAYGTARVVEDPEWLRSQLRDFSNRQEAGRPEPWSIDEPPEEFTSQLLNYIVGVEITIDRLVGKWFMSQHRSTSDRAGVVAGLRAEKTDAASTIAAMIEEYAPKKE